MKIEDLRMPSLFGFVPLCDLRTHFPHFAHSSCRGGPGFLHRAQSGISADGGHEAREWGEIS